MMQAISTSGNAAPGIAQTPDDAQADRIRAAEANLIAPCCYTQSIDVHMSEIAGTMRKEVTAMVLAGQSNLSIFAHYKAIYGERILMVPDGALGAVAYAVPVTTATVASGLLAFLLWKMHRRKAVVAASTVPVPLPERTGEAWLRLRSRVRQETDGSL